MMRSGEVVASEAWDSTGFKLHAEDPKWNFVAPSTGALGWIDTFAIPAKGENDAAAYKWINFVLDADVAEMQVRAEATRGTLGRVVRMVSPCAVFREFVIYERFDDAQTRSRAADLRNRRDGRIEGQ